MTSTTYPGVYIENNNSQRLTVLKNNTAVPAFFLTVEAADLLTQGKLERINGYMDYQKLMACITEEPDLTYINTINNCMRAYFTNGGTACYLGSYAIMENEVPKNDDINLLVQAGLDKAAFSSVVNKLVGPDNHLFAIYDGPREELSAETAMDYGYSGYAAVYYPWLMAGWSEEDIAPSAAIAGVYCKQDSTFGVWKAPANVTLSGLMPRFTVSDELQTAFTCTDGKALNMIRRFNNGPAVVWGAHTLNVESDEYRYIPVRRLLNSVQKDIRKAMKALVFEPNNQPTWEAVSSSITHYLSGLWKNGALQGAQQEQAFVVQVGKGITMTDEDIKNGIMIIKVGVAVIRPAEFIILQFNQETGCS